ncbi:MAG: hypothetical protein ACI9J3_001454 [Parvicellaceae bacterium]
MRILLIISFVLVGYIGSAQQFFNNTYDWGAAETGIGCEMIDDTLYTLGWTTDLVNRDIVVSKFDTNGNKIVDFIISDSIQLYAGKLGFYYDGYEHLIGYGSVIVKDTARAYAFKMKKNGQLVWSKYFQFNSLQMQLVGGCMGNDSNYVFCGYKYSPAQNWDYFYMKTDTSGNVLNSSSSGGLNNDLAYSISPGLDSGYILSGFNSSIEANGNLHLVKVDESGGLDWERDYGTVSGAESGSITVGKSWYWCYGGWTTVAGFTGQISKLNSSGFIVDQIIFDQVDIEQGNLHAGYELEDGSFIAVGSVKSPLLSDPQGWIVKVDSSCAEIWQRRPDKRLNDHYIYDFEELGDKSLLCIGVVFPDAGLSQDMWMFRTDSFGCIDLGCNGVGLIEEQIGNVIEAYPNPTYGYSTIEYQSSIKIEKLIVTDIVGNVVKSVNLNSKEGRASLDLSNQNSGIYFCSLVSEFRKLASVKLILVH